MADSLDLRVLVSFVGRDGHQLIEYRDSEKKGNFIFADHGAVAVHPRYDLLGIVAHDGVSLVGEANGAWSVGEKFRIDGVNELFWSSSDTLTAMRYDSECRSLRVSTIRDGAIYDQEAWRTSAQSSFLETLAVHLGGNDAFYAVASEDALCVLRQFNNDYSIDRSPIKCFPTCARFSPTGDWLAFTAEEPTGTMSLQVLNIRARVPAQPIQLGAVAPSATGMPEHFSWDYRLNALTWLRVNSGGEYEVAIWDGNSAVSTELPEKLFTDCDLPLPRFSRDGRLVSVAGLCDLGPRMMILSTQSLSWSALSIIDNDAAFTDAWVI